MDFMDSLCQMPFTCAGGRGPQPLTHSPFSACLQPQVLCKQEILRKLAAQSDGSNIWLNLT